MIDFVQLSKTPCVFRKVTPGIFYEGEMSRKHFDLETLAHLLHFQKSLFSRKESLPKKITTATNQKNKPEYSERVLLYKYLHPHGCLN